MGVEQAQEWTGLDKFSHSVIFHLFPKVFMIICRVKLNDIFYKVYNTVKIRRKKNTNKPHVFMGNVQIK